MKGVKDLHKEMLNVQLQLSILKSKKMKSELDVKEIFVLNRYYDCLVLDYMAETN